MEHAERRSENVALANFVNLSSAFPTLSAQLDVSILSSTKSFEAIFDTSSSSWAWAHDLSMACRLAAGKGELASPLNYGEILPESVFNVMHTIKTQHTVCPSARQVVYDLGSGSGRALFAACLSHPFAEAHGIEFLPALHANALQNLEIWRRKEVETNAPPLTEFFFKCADIARINKLDPNPTLLLCHATLFDDDLFACVQIIAENCDVGTTFTMVTKALGTGLDTGIETLGSQQCKMTWGETTVFTQRRV